MMIVFPAALSSGRWGEMAAYVSLCQVEVADGNGGVILDFSCHQRVRKDVVDRIQIPGENTLFCS